MKTLNINKYVLIMIGFVLTLPACNNDFLVKPEANLQVYIINELGELEIPDKIIAKETSVVFANHGESLFSIVYPGNKVLNEASSAKMVDTLVYTLNYDFEDIDKGNCIKTDGRRAVNGIPMQYKDLYDLYLSPTFKYRSVGEFEVYLEAINTDESSNTLSVTDHITIVVEEATE